MIPYAIGQERLSRVLRKHLKEYGVEVEYSSELIALEQLADHVSAKVQTGESVEVIDVPFVVGADGGKGELFPDFRGYEVFLRIVLLQST